jgi:hypothetical protein
MDSPGILLQMFRFKSREATDANLAGDVESDLQRWTSVSLWYCESIQLVFHPRQHSQARSLAGVA